jgi:hypothetical protein
VAITPASISTVRVAQPPTGSSPASSATPPSYTVDVPSPETPRPGFLQRHGPIPPESTSFTLWVRFAGGCVFGTGLKNETVIDRVDVAQTTTEVVVTAYTSTRNPLDPGLVCAGVGTLLPVQVHLDAPLGTRRLLDGSCTCEPTE